MTLWIIDTDHLSLLERKEKYVIKNFNQRNPNFLAITVVTFEEQIRGRLSKIKQANSDEKIIAAYSKLQGTADFLKQFNLIGFDSDACSCFNDFRRQKIRVGTLDLRIAAIAFSRNNSRNQETRFFQKTGFLV
ncbi:MAG: type II toxin-antitoxin system VapC family toxin [Okeania sp. SIO2H7]|nr:type II toxin-antitoxin system VapC family toxin [Okeania sp. SIO2H7]